MALLDPTPHSGLSQQLLKEFPPGSRPHSSLGSGSLPCGTHTGHSFTWFLAWGPAVPRLAPPRISAGSPPAISSIRAVGCCRPTGCLLKPSSLPAHTSGPRSSSPTPEMPSAFKVKCAGLGGAGGPNPYCSCSQLWLHPGTTWILEILLLLSQPQRF